MGSQVGVQGPGTLGEQITVEAVVVAQELIASANSAVVDGLNKGTIIFAINLGTFTGTPTFDAKVQESDASGSGFTDASAADMYTGASVAIAQQSAGDALFLVEVDTRKLKRYKRLAITIAGGSPVCPTGVVAISHPSARGPAA